MTIYVNIGEAKTRLSELIGAAVRGEEVVLSKAGTPQVRLVAIDDASVEERKRIAAKRRAAIGMWAADFKGWDSDVPRSIADEDLDARWRRKFGPSA